MHGHGYRHPEVFQGKHLVILGAASSGQDICLQAAKHAEKVYLKKTHSAVNFQKTWNDTGR